MKNIGKYILGLVVVLFFVGYVFFSRQNSGTSTQGTLPPAVSTPGTTPAPATSTASSGSFKNGTYTGTAADAFYGTVQVAAVVSGGQLTDVQVLQSPGDNGHSMQLSNYALPQLKQEAIASQSSNVNIVSGATQTSQAFQQSLAAALAQAKA